MKNVKNLLLFLLILPLSVLSQTLTGEQVLKLRAQQLRLFECEDLQVDYLNKIDTLNAQVLNREFNILQYKEKEQNHQHEKSYYWEQIKIRDKSINRFEKKTKLLKIGFITFGSTTALLLLINQIN